jgi:hypothetical protein
MNGIDKEKDVYPDEESLEEGRFGEPEEATETTDITVAHGVHKQLHFF